MAWALVLLPLVAAGIVGLAGEGRRRVLWLIPMAGLGATLVVAARAAAVQPAATLRWSAAIRLQLAVTGFGRVMVVLVPVVALAVVVYALASEAADLRLRRLVSLLVGFVAAMELLVVAGDFLTLLLAWELVGACSWALIGHRSGEPGVAAAANQAFVATRAGDVGLYLAAAAAFAASGSFAFADLPAAGWRLDVIAAGVLLAAAAKSAQLPFSPWLFSAMAGPTPVSALLHSATMVAAGAYALVRLAPAFSGLGWFGPTVAALGLATALAGGVVASLQGDLKRVLAASTSAQYGLMLVAVGAGSTTAAGAHLVAHAAFKSLLFLGAGVAIHAAGSGDLGRLRMRRQPRWAAALFGLGALALAAVPPTGGAASKEAIVAAASDRWAIVGFGVLVAGALSAFYASRVYLLAFGRTAPPDRRTGVEDENRSAPPNRRTRAEIAAMAVLGGATLATSALWLPAGRRLLERNAGDPWPEAGAVALVPALATVLLGVGAAWLLDRRGHLLDLRLSPGWRVDAADWLALPRATKGVVVDPVLGLARFLARVDDRVVDAGVLATARVAAALSGALSWWGERGVDGIVHGVAGGTLVLSRFSRTADERGVDAAVEGVAGGVGVAGRQSRRLQTGLTHQYFLIVAAGVVVVVAVAVLGRS